MKAMVRTEPRKPWIVCKECFVCFPKYPNRTNTYFKIHRNPIKIHQNLIRNEIKSVTIYLKLNENLSNIANIRITTN